MEAAKSRIVVCEPEYANLGLVLWAVTLEGTVAVILRLELPAATGVPAESVSVTQSEALACCDAAPPKMTPGNATL